MQTILFSILVITSLVLLPSSCLSSSSDNSKDAKSEESLDNEILEENQSHKDGDYGKVGEQVADSIFENPNASDLISIEDSSEEVKSCESPVKPNLSGPFYKQLGLYHDVFEFENNFLYSDGTIISSSDPTVRKLIKINGQLPTKMNATIDDSTGLLWIAAWTKEDKWTISWFALDTELAPVGKVTSMAIDGKENDLLRDLIEPTTNFIVNPIAKTSKFLILNIPMEDKSFIHFYRELSDEGTNSGWAQTTCKNSLDHPTNLSNWIFANNELMRPRTCDFTKGPDVFRIDTATGKVSNYSLEIDNIATSSRQSAVNFFLDIPGAACP